MSLALILELITEFSVSEDWFFFLKLKNVDSLKIADLNNLLRWLVKKLTFLSEDRQILETAVVPSKFDATKITDT
jgi:hypothetical protein